MSYESYVRWRQNNPEKYAYNNIRNRAKQRGKPFTITFEYFLKFCRKYEYIKNKGKTVDSMTVDCIINELGYVPGNIRPLPLSENSRKGTKTLKYQWWDKKAWVEETTVPDVEGNFDDGFEDDKGW